MFNSPRLRTLLFTRVYKINHGEYIYIIFWRLNISLYDSVHSKKPF